MSDVAETIKTISELPEKLGDINFSDVVYATTGYRINKLNLENKNDSILIDKLIDASINFLSLCKKNKRRFRGNRPNDVSRAFESEVVEEIRKRGFKTTMLTRMGYPDIELIDNLDRITYIEIKAHTRKNKDSTFRSFYYTTGEKITSDAFHLLLGFLIEEETPKYWKIMEFQLLDLSELFVSLKAEFNSNNRMMYSDELTLAKS